MPRLGLGKEARINAFYLLSYYELLDYIPWFVVSKSLRIEVFRTGLVYYQCFLTRPATLRFGLKIPEKTPVNTN